MAPKGKVARPTPSGRRWDLQLTSTKEVRPRDVRGALEGPRMSLRSEQERSSIFAVHCTRPSNAKLQRAKLSKKETRPDDLQTWKLYSNRIPLCLIRRPCGGLRPSGVGCRANARGAGC
jgi:hypothetical protein